MSRFRITSLLDENEWAETCPTLFPSMSAAFKALERSVDSAEDGGVITRSFYKGDTLTIFGRVNSYDCAWQIVPVAEVPA